jgi:dTDP-4-dehydrorhamnose reductase
MSGHTAKLNHPFSGRPEPSVWGGIECTINRTRDGFRDQLAETGHYERSEEDIKAIASLGIRALRYPLLWEKMQPEEDGTIDWSWADLQLQRIKQQGITPIAGLLHHGSGPAWTDLAHPAFPEQFAAYAKQVALRFPWLQYYTPINEPLTTARLYGHWYPHAKDDRSFIKMLLNQLKGIVLAMQEIRKINPSAVLVQTEDLCKIHSTGAMAGQAAFENERRWLTWDLLCGKVTAAHALWNWLRSVGIDEPALHFFTAHPCPPGIIGCNYYVTSERYLDECTALYPAHTHGGNGSIAYADMECVRVQQPAGLKVLLTETWDRYNIGIAVTETHLHCTREEQLRWFAETWEVCCGLNKEGIRIEAVTAWALLGSYDWCSLVTRNDRQYEAGAFKITPQGLAETALATLIRSLAHKGVYQHPLLSSAGWWNSQGKQTPGQNPQPVLLLGEKNLCALLAGVCKKRSVACITVPFSKDSTPWIIRAMSGSYYPWGIIYATEQPPSRRLVQLVAEACNDTGIAWMSLAPRLFFDGHTAVAGIGLQIAVPDGPGPCPYEKETGAIYGNMHDAPFLAGLLPLLDNALDLFIDATPGNWALMPGKTIRTAPGEALPATVS